MTRPVLGPGLVPFLLFPITAPPHKRYTLPGLPDSVKRNNEMHLIHAVAIFIPADLEYISLE